MLLQELIVSLEAAHDIFRWLKAIDAHDRLLAEQGTKLLGGSSARRALNKLKFSRHRDRDRVGTRLRDMSSPFNGPLFKLYLRVIEQRARALQKIARIPFGLETDNIIAHQALIDLLSNIAG